MPSLVLGYVPGSGFTPLVSGSYKSGLLTPIGGIQIVADRANSGSIYMSLSGAFPISGQVSSLVGSGGATIQSGAMPLSGGINSGLNDGLQIAPGAGFFIPHMAILNTGPTSGTYSICFGCDPAVSGLGRIYFDFF